MNGKAKCKILKEIRRQIAENNDIEYTVSECQFQGECKGTCPRCEAEVAYLEEQLEKRKRVGKAVAIAGIAVAVTVGAVGCTKAVKEYVEDFFEEDMLQGVVGPGDIGV